MWIREGKVSAEPTDDVGLLLKAIEFSAEKHRKQRRKDAEASPYINHPIAVAALLANVGKVRNMDVLCAAVLHDTIEDTLTSRKSLTRRSAGRFVSWCRKLPTTSDGPRTSESACR